MNRTILNNSNVKNFVLAGNSHFTLQNGNTGEYHVYRIKKSDTNDNLYYVYNLRSNDNTDDKAYQYIGCYFDDTDYFHINKHYKDTPKDYWPQSIKQIAYLLSTLDNVPSNLHIYHHGKCAKCGRLLTTPESIERGLGPECYKRSKEL